MPEYTLFIKKDYRTMIGNEYPIHHSEIQIQIKLTESQYEQLQKILTQNLTQGIQNINNP